MDFIKKLFGGDIRQLGMIGALVFLILFFQWSTDGLTLTPDNVNNIIRGNAHILVLAIGMVLVIIAGHIDLSTPTAARTSSRWPRRSASSSPSRCGIGD